MKPLLEALKALGMARLASLAAVAFAMLGLLTILAVRGPAEQFASLYSDLDLREAGDIATILDQQKIPHQLAGSGTQILVRTDDVPRARVLLAKNGLPSGGSIGNELLDRTDSLTATPFQQSINQARALEGELARTIRAIQGVKAARVHLVLPRHEPFSHDQQSAQASVLLTMTNAARLDAEGTRAVVNLVAAAVPGLRPSNVAVTDTRGNVLASAGELNDMTAALVSNQQLRQATELRLSRGIEAILDRSLGPNRSRAQTSIVYDYDQVHETQEHYDPDGQVVRSVQNVTNSSKSTEGQNSVSVQNNLPNADAGTAPSGSQDQRQEETTNYEVTKTIRSIIHDQPRIARISMAVMVDGIVDKGRDGSLVWRERPADELDKIGRLVRTAIGYDEKRGDKVDIVTMRFADSLDPPDAGQATPLPLGLTKSDLLHLVQTGLVGVLAILGLLLVLRPMMQQLLPQAGVQAVAVNPLTGEILPAPLANAGPDSAKLRPILTGPTATAGLLAGPGGASQPATGAATGRGLAGVAGEDESMLQLAQIEGQLRASSIRRIADLVDRHPDESLAIVRSWIHEEAA